MNKLEGKFPGCNYIDHKELEFCKKYLKLKNLIDMLGLKKTNFVIC